MFFFNYEIKSKNGKQSEVISYFTNEKEVLFRENTKFRILSVEQIDGINIIKMEEL